MPKTTDAGAGDLSRLDRADRIVAIDFETTGLHPAKRGEAKAHGAGSRPPGCVIEIGCVALERHAGTWRWAGTFHSLVDPGTFIMPEARKVHGISRDSLRGAPRFWEVADALRAFTAGAVLAAHDHGCERDCLDYEMARAKRIAWGRPGHDPSLWLCTQAAFEAAFPTGRQISLDAACDGLGISRKARTRHGALVDAALTAEVLVSLLERRSASRGARSRCGDRLAA